MNWLPISTAPKDGKNALFFQKGNPKASVDNARDDIIRIDKWWGGERGNFYREYPEAPYTHWAALPDKPN